MPRTFACASTGAPVRTSRHRVRPRSPLPEPLAPLKEQYVDIRTLDRGRKFEGRYYGGVAEAEARKSKEAAGETGGFDVGSFFSGFGKKK